MSKLNISFSNLKRIGAMSLAIMTFSGCSKAVANTTSSQNESNSYVAGSYSDELLDEINFTEIGAVDATTGRNIAGATLVIRDENGDIVYEFVTTDERIFINLKIGNYTLIETIAPEGYEVSSSNVISFKVGSDNSAIIINKPQKKVKTR